MSYILRIDVASFHIFYTRITRIIETTNSRFFYRNFIDLRQCNFGNSDDFQLSEMIPV